MTLFHIFKNVYTYYSTLFGTLTIQAEILHDASVI